MLSMLLCKREASVTCHPVRIILPMARVSEGQLTVGGMDHQSPVTYPGVRALVLTGAETV